MFAYFFQRNTAVFSENLSFFIVVVWQYLALGASQFKSSHSLSCDLSASAHVEKNQSGSVCFQMWNRGVCYVSEVPQDDSFKLRVWIWRLITKENQISYKILSREAKSEHASVTDVERAWAVMVSSKLKIATEIETIRDYILWLNHVLPSVWSITTKNNLNPWLIVHYISLFVRDSYWIYVGSNNNRA